MTIMFMSCYFVNISTAKIQEHRRQIGTHPHETESQTVTIATRSVATVGSWVIRVRSFRPADDRMDSVGSRLQVGRASDRTVPGQVELQSGALTTDHAGTQ